MRTVHAAYWSNPGHPLPAQPHRSRGSAGPPARNECFTSSDALRHYVYYRVGAADLEAALAAARAVQQRLRERCPGLAAELLRRPSEAAGQVTLMEVYAFADAAQAAAVETAAAQATARWLLGDRHVEVFDPVA